MEALRNIVGDFLYQFRVRGGLGLRLLCVSTYYGVYVVARAGGLSRDESRLRALRVIGRLGFSQRPVVVRVADGFELELDVFAACYLSKEILADLTYEQDPTFRPRAGWTVLDIGAHQGLFAVRAAELVGASGRVIAVEAFPSNCARLRRNAERNGLRNIVVVEAAAAEREGRADLHINTLMSGGQSLVYSHQDYEGVVEVATATVDGLLQQLDIQSVDLVKIDVEGSAPRVLDGAPRLLRARPPLVMEVEGGAVEVSKMSARLRSLGYRTNAVGAILYARVP